NVWVIGELAPSNIAYVPSKSRHAAPSSGATRCRTSMNPALTAPSARSSCCASPRSMKSDIRRQHRMNRAPETRSIAVVVPVRRAAGVLAGLDPQARHDALQEPAADPGALGGARDVAAHHAQHRAHVDQLEALGPLAARLLERQVERDQALDGVG